jgi:hypothetical protein
MYFIKSGNKENDIRNSSRPELQANIHDALSCGFVESVETEIVDDEEYEAIEISLRLAEKISQKSAIEPIEPGAQENKEVQNKFSVSADVCWDKRTPAKCPSARKPPLQNAQPRLELLLVGTSEFDTVKALFQKTCSNYTVVGIERCTLTPHHPLPTQSIAFTPLIPLRLRTSQRHRPPP